ncbi:MAG: phosphoribosylformylglycinamidine synthase [Tissierellia bacterium]|nr:phosphoribosylformylglycinamidine synthase [Tissierellia bacterium]
MNQIYIEKKPEFRSHNEQLKREIQALYDFELQDLRIINLYYRPQEFSEEIINKIFSEPALDLMSSSFTPPAGYRVLRTEFLPGQFDQRAFWASKCLEILGEEEEIYSSHIYLLKGVSEDKWEQVKSFFINPVESYERELQDFSAPSLRTDEDITYKPMEDLFEITGEDFCAKYNLAMEGEDITYVRDYFAKEGRPPSFSELRLIDTYWSDHCRHTTFNTELREIDFSMNNLPLAEKVFNHYDEKRLLYTKKPRSLMDLAIFSIRKEKAAGNLEDLEESEEINACSIERRFGDEDYLIMFKNETHNHPTEIEPFGGAATCLGGAIRDPLSGRSFVYQAMRVTGARDPKNPRVLPGKLPQQIITKRAAQGYSSYGNQIGLCAGHIKEYYHPGFEAKRLEAGFVIASAKRSHVVRGIPKNGDLLLLLGGATGRDGIGGAAGSSKSHQEDVATGAASEVQKGNAPEERKLQRFFRLEDIGPKIVRCNDLGAGGISVAFGEIAPGLQIELKEVPTKYQGIYPWEILLSESQERMALVIEAKDLELFKKRAQEEDLSLTILGEVTHKERFVVTYKGKTLVDLRRDFIEQAGAPRKANVAVEPVDLSAYPYALEVEQEELRSASQQGLVEMFDSSVGGLNVLNPYGGKRRKSFVDGMVSKIPGVDTDDVTIATQGFDPYLAQWSPFHGAQMAVIQSISKNIVLGGDLKGLRLSFQEYFEALGKDPKKWAKPFMALLGANSILHHFGLASIGGKDSMSGSFYWEGGELHVPPSLISFCVNTGKLADVRSSEFKAAGNDLYLYEISLDANYCTDLDEAKKTLEAYIADRGKILSASVVTLSLSQAAENACFGNHLGCSLVEDGYPLGSILVEVAPGTVLSGGRLVGHTLEKPELHINEEVRCLDESLEKKEDYLRPLFELEMVKAPEEAMEKGSYEKQDKKDTVEVFIPIFPGTNSEDEFGDKFEKAGAQVHRWVFSTEDMKNSLTTLSQKIRECDVLALAGGFSAADEPEGSAKFIATVFRNKEVKEAFHDLIDRKGLVLGICNGFQALVKLGVFYNGRIEEPENITMGLTYNHIGRHQSNLVRTRCLHQNSPWLSRAQEGNYWNVVSHGEGRFFMNEKDRELLESRKQIATVYVDNPNGSMMNIEGLVSPDGRIFGKMCHNERIDEGFFINVYDGKDMDIFSAGIEQLRR